MQVLWVYALMLMTKTRVHTGGLHFAVYFSSQFFVLCAQCGVAVGHAQGGGLPPSPAPASPPPQPPLCSIFARMTWWEAAGT
jgi:hypothetical protein